MRRLFSRKSVDDTKSVKEDGKEGKTRKLLFGRSHGAKKDDAPHQEASKQQQQQAPNQHDSSTNSSASSAVSIPPSAPYLPTPSGSSSSFSSVMSYNELSSPTSDSTTMSTAPSSTLSRLPGSNTSITSLNSPPSHPGSLAVPPPSSTPASRPQSSHTEQKKPLSPLSVVVDLHSVHTPPPSDDEEDNLQPKRRNSIYNIFRKSQSQPNLNSGPPSRSSSTTTLPSAYNAPQGSGTTLAPPLAPNNHRKSVKFLRRKSSNHSFEDVVGGEGILSRNEATARRAILQGDPLGGGAYLYPMGLASKSDLMHQPPPQQQGSRSRRGAAGRIYDPRSSWGGSNPHGNGGMAWRAPHIGGRNGGKMTIEEENDMMEQHQQHQREMGVAPGGFVEDTPQFQQPRQQRLRPPMNRRPTSSQSGRANFPGYGYFNGNDNSRPGYYPPFAPPPMLPVIIQQTAQSAQA